MSVILRAFSGEEYDRVQSGLAHLVRMLGVVPGGGKVEEDYWAKVYRTAKGYSEPDNWSNLPFRDFIEDGIGVEWKLLKRKSPSEDQGRSLMHPAATRTIEYDPGAPAQACADKVLTQWGQRIEEFRERVAHTGTSGSADIRWGILLWAQDLSEFLYFEEELVPPRLSDFRGEWVDGNHRGKATRNLHIFNRESGQKKFSVTLPRKGAKLQPYFDVPTVQQGAHLFRVENQQVKPIVVDEATHSQFVTRANAVEMTQSEYLEYLLRIAAN
jgi:hypothetical protein